MKKNQNSEKILLLVESIIIFAFIFIAIFSVNVLIRRNHREKYFIGLKCLNIFYLIVFIPCMICQSVFIKRIIANDLLYECSDEITNEILNQEYKNTKKTIIYSAINLAADCLIIILLIYLFIIMVLDSRGCCGNCDKEQKQRKEPIINSNKTDNIPIQNITYSNKENTTIGKSEEGEYNNPIILNLNENRIAHREISKPETNNLEKINPTQKDENPNPNFKS